MSLEKNEIFTITLKGRIEFEPENRTRKHELQASWKKVAMVIFDKSEVEDYYRWFFRKRFNLDLLSTIRGPHVTFINDALENIHKDKGTLEDKLKSWDALKKKWHGKEIEVTFNLRPFYDLDSNWERHIPRPLTEEEKASGKSEKVSHTYHWWLIVDHQFREGLQAIRSEIGLDKPYFGMHMTFGILTQNYKMDNNGKLIWGSNGKPIPIFNQQLEHAKYIHSLHEKGLVEINKDYGKPVVKNDVQEEQQNKTIKNLIFNFIIKIKKHIWQTIK